MTSARTPTPVSAPAVDAKTGDDAKDGQVADQAIETDAVDDRAEATIPARILLDHLDFRANTVALLTEAEAESCEGWADTDPAAVEYAASLTE
jgi:hypothetical protein